MKPFLKWVGGKTMVVPAIKERLPKDFTDYKFVEPFVGAGAVFLKFEPQHFHINDYNKELVNCYEVIKNHIDELVNELTILKSMNTKTDFERIRGWDRGDILEERTAIERAARTIYLNKTCFNGLYRVNSKGQFNASFANNPRASILEEANLREIHEYLNSSKNTITNLDYQQMLSLVVPGDFIYLDPPYASSNNDGFTAYTDKKFNNQDQIFLRDELVRLDELGIKWLYSNADVPFIRDLFKEYDKNTINISVVRKVGQKAESRGAAQEVLISNYDDFQGGRRAFFEK